MGYHRSGLKFPRYLCRIPALESKPPSPPAFLEGNGTHWKMVKVCRVGCIEKVVVRHGDILHKDSNLILQH